MKRSADYIGLALVRLFVLIMLALVVVPFVYTIIMSIDPRRYLGPFPPPGVSFQWYERFFSAPRYMRALGTSLVLALATGFGAVLLGTLAALGLSRSRGPLLAAASGLFAMPQLEPHVVLGFSLLLLFSMVGLGGGFLALLCAHVVITLPYVVRAVGASLVGIRPSMTEAAMSLGASRARAMWDIVLPLARSGIAVGFVLAITVSLDEVAASVFLTVPGTTTLPVILFSDMQASFNLTIAAAATVMVGLSLAAVVALDRLIGIDRLLGRGAYGGGLEVGK